MNIPENNMKQSKPIRLVKNYVSTCIDKISNDDEKRTYKT